MAQGSNHITPLKASQKLGAGPTLFGVGREPVYEYNPRTIVVLILSSLYFTDKKGIGNYDTYAGLS